MNNRTEPSPLTPLRPRLHGSPACSALPPRSFVLEHSARGCSLLSADTSTVRSSLRQLLVQCPLLRGAGSNHPTEPQPRLSSPPWPPRLLRCWPGSPVWRGARGPGPLARSCSQRPEQRLPHCGRSVGGVEQVRSYAGGCRVPVNSTCAATPSFTVASGQGSQPAFLSSLTRRARCLQKGRPFCSGAWAAGWKRPAAPLRFAPHRAQS